MILLSTLLLPLLPAMQSVGGDSQILHQWDGAALYDESGNSVANAGDVNGDGYDDSIVGVSHADPGGVFGAGSAYVYSGSNGSILYRFDGVNLYDNFGYAVAAAGDVNLDGFADVIVSAPYADPAGVTDSGAAYVFSGADGSVLYQFVGQNYYDLFGYSVAGGGDQNGDGYPDLIVGAISAAPLGRTGSGAAYVYSGFNGTRLHLWDGPAGNENHGASVANAGDVNGDGFADAIIGSRHASPSGLFYAGSAYVYSGVSGAILYQWDGEAANDLFGNAVAGAGDLNNDGFADLIVGAHLADSGTSIDSGAAYTFSGLTGALLQKWTGEATDDWFGWSVAGAGDLNRDGFADVVVGAYGADPGGRSMAGSAFVYSGSINSIARRWDGVFAGDRLGFSVASAGDSNHDGYNDLLLSATGAWYSGLVDSGTTFVYSYEPYLSASLHAASASTGGVMTFDLDFPNAAAGYGYKILISETGIGPTNYGVDIPLTQDSLVMDTFFGTYPVPVTSNMQGTLNASGNATASMTIPAGIPPALVGRVYYLAAIATPTGALPAYSSVALPLTIIP